MNVDIDRTKYVTELQEEQSGHSLWRSGRYIGTLTVPKGQRPFKDREATYEVVKVHENKRTMRGDEAVMEAMDDTDDI